MRRILCLSALFTLTVPMSWASDHTHVPVNVRVHASSPTVMVHTHAPSLFPKADLVNLGEGDGANTRTAHESTFAGFVVRTMLGFSAHFSH